MKKQIIRCPYCGSVAVLKNASHVYGEKSKGGLVYVCNKFPDCNAYVGVHQGTHTPKGTLANPTLRRKRIYAHHVFDQLWKQGVFSKPEAYRWIADKFGMNKRQAHIGNFSEYLCDQLIHESLKVLRNNCICLQAVS